MNGNDMKARALFAVVTAAVFFGTITAAANAGTTVKSGEVLTTQTASALDTAALKAGDTFTLDVVEPYPPGAGSLAGAKVLLTVTDVTHEAPNGRARVGFLFQRITFSNGRSEPIAGFVLSSNVVRRGQVVAAAPTPALPAPPPAPPMGGMSSTSSNTVFWQKRIGSPSSSSSPSASQVSTGGYAYARSGDARLPAGSTVKIQLSRDLNVPF